MQADQVQKLTQLIKTSPVLRASEREAWLAMLPVMNDKQAADLFSILTVIPKPVATPSRVPVSVEGFKTPQLRHITNLPTGMPLEEPANLQNKADTEAKPKTSVTQAQVQMHTRITPIAEIIKQRLEEKELPEGEEPLELPAGHQVKSPLPPVMPLTSQPIADSELVGMRAKIANPVTKPADKPRIPFQQKTEYIPLDEMLNEQKIRHENTASVPSTTTKQAQVPSVGANQARELSSLEDILHCGPETLRTVGFEVLRDQIINVVRKFGYFNVVLSFEKSLLYQAYLKTGHGLLSATDNQAGPLSKPEFEQVTDLLRSMQVSQTN